MIDSTIVRAHLCSAGAQKKWRPGGAGFGTESRRFTTKIHVIVDGLGNPLRLRLTAGQVADISQAIELVDGLAFET